MAMAAVTDFGAIAASTGGGAPNAQAMPTAETTAVTDPASRAASSGSSARATSLRLRHSGSASATVAGPSRK